MSPKPKSLRTRLSKNGQSTCFYCGLAFHINPLEKEDNLYRTFSKNARMTLEHLIPVGKGGETKEQNCVLSHKWCNETAKDLPIEEKLKLRDTLLHYVETYKWVPWKYKYRFRPMPNRLTGERPVIKGKSKLKENLLKVSDRCNYCDMKFGIVPVEPGTLIYKKLKSYARMIVVPLMPFSSDMEYDVNNCILVHHWCQNKAKDLPSEERIALIISLKAKCKEENQMPWITEKLLNKHLEQGGTIIKVAEQ